MAEGAGCEAESPRVHRPDRRCRRRHGGGWPNGRARRAASRAGARRHGAARRLAADFGSRRQCRCACTRGRVAPRRQRCSGERAGAAQAIRRAVRGRARRGAVQHALAPRQQRRQRRAARRARRDGHRSREHTPLDEHRIRRRVGKQTLRTPVASRLADQDLLHFRPTAARGRVRRRGRELRSLARSPYRRRHLRAVSRAERHRRRRRSGRRGAIHCSTTSRAGGSAAWRTRRRNCWQ